MPSARVGGSAVTVLVADIFTPDTGGGIPVRHLYTPGGIDLSHSRVLYAAGGTVRSETVKRIWESNHGRTRLGRAIPSGDGAMGSRPGGNRRNKNFRSETGHRDRSGLRRRPSRAVDGWARLVGDCGRLLVGGDRSGTGE